MKLKKWVFGFVLVGLLAYGLFQQKQDAGQGAHIVEDSEVVTTSSNDVYEITITKDQVYQGDLVLVNANNPIQSERTDSEIIHLLDNQQLVKGFVVLDRTIRLPKDVLEKFTTMVEAAAQDGVNNFIISSGYRDYDEQKRLYKENGKDYALPAGYSEHNLGLSLDIGSTLMSMSEAPEGAWLQKNAPKHGFILRYPKHKTDITGIQYEPWHFRYVGLPHSQIMQDKDWTLEEYLDHLKEKKSIQASVNGTKYKIMYESVSSKKSIEIPKNHHYELSGNNMDGVIVTVQL